MDKNAIKKYAVWARNELIARVTQKAEQYEITEKKTTPKDAESINGRLLTDAEKNQRKALIEKIQADGFEQVMEEVAYTWFNRFTALRFMEVNNYLPSHTRVFTNEAGEFKPQILTDAIQLDLEGLDMDKVFELKDTNKTEELYKYLLITQCNALSAVLPRMFQKIEHYTELLLPDYLLREGSVIEQMIELIPEEDWTDQVQIIGWLYQYYNTEPKAEVFAKKGIVTKEEVPAATQLFTPDWIVHYMVENSLGRLWLEGHPNDFLKDKWNFYLDEAEQEIDVMDQVEIFRKEAASLKPEDIRCIDPCMGSGHILSYMFDVLVKIYEDYGYGSREAVANIVEKNLWGLDIDERAAQLSYFAVMMKARQYDRRFLTRGFQPHVYAIEESNGITSAPMHDMGVELSQEEYAVAVKQALRLVEEMHDAKELGSILHVTPCDWDLLRRFAVPRGGGVGQMRMDIHGEIAASEKLQVLINIGEALSNTYDVAVTNPPYLVVGNCSSKVIDYVKKNYAEYKQDLYSVFIKRCNEFVKKNGYQAMITQHGWMFLSSFESMRAQVSSNRIVNMAHLGPRAFEEIGGEVVQTVSFILNRNKIKNYKGTYCRLVEPNSQDGKMDMFVSGKNRYYVSQDSFNIIPGNPIAYWANSSVLLAYKEGKPLSKVAEPKQGLKTGDNDTFLRLWHEIDITRFSVFEGDGAKWFPCNKGGEYRRWYGNNDYVIDWENDGYKLKNFRHPDGRLKSRPQNLQYMKKEGLTYTNISSGNLGIRYSPEGFLFDAAGSMIFTEKSRLYYILAFLGSNVASLFTSITSPTMSFEVGQLSTIPVRIEMDPRIDDLVKECIEIEKAEWDSFENSWDYKAHPFITTATIEKNKPISWHYEEWSKLCERRFEQVLKNEEELNSIFISIYGLEGSLSPKVNPKNVSVRKADLSREIRSLISYAVGCMFGRYSLDTPGLVFAGGTWDPSKYKFYKVDKDAIIPICDDEYFADDIVGRFVSFIETVFGKDNLEENLQYIADALGTKGSSSREAIRNYFINDFYNDHLKNYQKRPIYWLFDSGKKNGFKCLVYMHRFKADTIARIRTDYVHEQQSRYRTALESLQERVSALNGGEKITANKRLAVIQAQSSEIQEYEEKIHHLADQMISINLDDGVKKNYALFSDVLRKI